MKGIKVLLFMGLICFWSCKKESNYSPCQQEINKLKINQFQYLNSHNSYRIRTYEPLYNFIDKALGLFSKYQQPSNWDYTHEPLETQFNEYQIRSIELDVYDDPQGGHYYHRQGNRLIGEPTESGIPEMNLPGLKIFHQPDFDYMTHHYTFKDALQTVEKWSDAHPRHLPITIIKEVFGESLKKVITPDEVRKDHESLEAAILADGWPTLKEARGKILFVLINSGFELTYYLEDHPSLAGRVMFAFSKPGKPECAFTRINNPEKSVAEIQDLVAKGYIVRTRADKAPKEAKDGSYDRQIAALTSGAQIISTDYYRPDPRHQENDNWTDYQMQFPDNAVVILNPINADSLGIDCLITE